MCGRFAYVAAKDRLKYQFNLANAIDAPSRFNIAPGADILCIMQTNIDEKVALLLQWGLIPSWVKDRSKMRPLINARCDTVLEKPSFRQAIKSRRCLIPMSGFYEWREEVTGKQPYFFKKNNEALLAVAALWETWQQDDVVFHTCCLITTDANALVGPVHNRMPLLLDERAQELWLDNSTFDELQLKELMRPYPGEDLIGYPVTNLVNKSAFDCPAAIEPL